MTLASLVPTSETDASSNITSGSFTDIDNTIAAPSATPIVCNNNSWTNQSNNTQNGEILFGLTDAPGDFDSFTSIRVQIRARVPATGEGDTSTWRMEIEGTNAPTTTLEWDDTEDGDGYVNKEFTNSTVTPSAADIDGWVVHIYQWLYNQDMGPDGLEWQIDEIELILDYTVASGENFQNVDGALSFAGGMVKQAQISPDGALSFAGGLVGLRTAFSTIAGALSFVGELTKEAQISPDGILSFTGGLVKQARLSPDGTVSFSGGLVKQAQISPDGVLTFGGALASSLVALKTVEGVLSFAGALIKQAEISPDGTLTFTGDSVEQAQKNLAGTLSFNGAIIKLVNKNLAGELSFTGALFASVLFSKAVIGTLSFVGDLGTLFSPGGLTVRRMWQSAWSRVWKDPGKMDEDS